MEHSIKRALRSAGKAVSVEYGDLCREGYAVIYPSRKYFRLTDGISHDPGGRGYGERFVMFSCRELLSETGHGAIVSCGDDRYEILWTDAYCLRSGGYSKTLLRKIGSKEDEHCPVI